MRTACFQVCGISPVTLTELTAVLLSQMLFSGCQLDNLVLINKIKEQLMAEKIRPPHLPPASAPSQQPTSAPSIQADGVQHRMSKAQQTPVLHSHGPSQPDIALHARPASSSVTGSLTSLCIDNNLCLSMASEESAPTPRNK